MAHYRVLVTDYAWPTLDVERDVLAAIDAELMVAHSGDEAELIALAPHADAILTCWQKVTPAVLEAAVNCRVVSRYGVGLDNIAVARATELGMIVTNVPDFCLEEVSDHAMALLLACARRIVPFVRATRAGVWDPKAAPTMPRLRGQTLGIIGYGNIAQALLPKARGFGLNVIVYTPRLLADALGAQGRVTNQLDELLREADYISIHAPLTAETRGLINEETLRQMKPTAFLINTSRGAIVDEAALIHALQKGEIAGAALDVLVQEPPPPDHPLLAMENVIVTPHTAFYSESAIEELAHKAAHHVVQALQGEVPARVINPEVLRSADCRLLLSPRS